MMGVYVQQDVVSPSERAIIVRYQVNPPVDVVGLANAFGINAWESNSLPPDISGTLFRDPQNGGASGYSIIVKASDPYVRKRFTTAHEIAHFLLHRQAIRDRISDDQFYRGGLTRAQETEANNLAAEILMPVHLIHGMMNAGTRDMAVLANTFGVSQVAMMNRFGFPIP